MKYSGNFLYPPRPSHAIAPNWLDSYERDGYWGQAKLNGTCAFFSGTKDGELLSLNRHNEEHKQWALGEQMRKELTAPFKGIGHYAIVGELMHAKTQKIKDTFYIFDILAIDGKSLNGTTYADRYSILESLYPSQETTLTHHVVGSKVWMARNHKENLGKVYEAISDLNADYMVNTAVPFEGLVLKRPDGKLKNCFKEGTNGGWQAKCRFTSKNYGF